MRRVVRKDAKTGQPSTVYEVFDTPYGRDLLEGEAEEARDLASGESPAGASAPLPPGEEIKREQPPSPGAPGPRVSGPAERLLSSLGRTEPRPSPGFVAAALGGAEAARAPLRGQVPVSA